MPRSLSLSLLSVFLLTACGPTEDPIEVAIDASCEWSSDAHCMLPWPSDRWLEADATTATGLRLAYDSNALPSNKDGVPVDVAPYTRMDGFSPSSQLLTMFDEAVDLDGMAVRGAWDQSVASDSRSLIIDLETGELVPHMVENDVRAEDGDGTLLYLRPATRLAEAHRYGVALRDIHLQGGGRVEATPAFAALRDGVITTSQAIEDARPRYEALFTALEDYHGVDRADIVQGWTFTTASGGAAWSDLLAQRDDALQRVPVGAGECVIEQVIDEPYDGVRAQVRGTFRAPLYMDSEIPGGRTVRGADGLPAFQGWYDVDFLLHLPPATTGPVPLVQAGHGLMMSATRMADSAIVRRMSAERGAAVVLIDLQGMSMGDVVTVGGALADVSGLASVTDRLTQGLTNSVVVSRSLLGACGDLPELQGDDGQRLLSTDEAYFVGTSMGAIFGTTMMAIHPDIDRGALVVGGANFPLLLTRSLNWVEFEAIMRSWYLSRVDRELLMALAVSLWDRVQPDAYAVHLLSDPLPGVGPKRILSTVAVGDLQVQNLGSDMAARMMGLPLQIPSTMSPWGVEQIEGISDSAMVYYDLQVPGPPDTNELPEDVNNVHNHVSGRDELNEQIHLFFQPDGRVEPVCDGACDPT